MRHARSVVVARVLLYGACAVLLTWPLAASLGTHLPLGRLPEATVPWLNLWTLRWNADRVAHGFAAYFDAPIFFPARGALAMSEPMTLQGLLFTPLSALFGAIAAYNLVLLACLLANGLALHRLLARLGCDALAATCGGVLGVALPFAIKELGVLQLVCVAPCVLALGELVVLMREPDAADAPRGPRARAWLWLGAYWTLTLWSCVYYALFLSLLLALSAPFLFVRRALDGATLRALCLAAVCALCAAAPLVYVQHHAVSGQPRSAKEIRSGSASAHAYLRAGRDTLIARLAPPLRAPENWRALYPGALLVILAGYGAWQRLRLRASDRDRRFVVYALVALLASLLLSFGTRLRLGPLHPYETLVQDLVPGYAQLRSPYRFAVFTQLLLCTFAGVGLAALAGRVRRASWALPLTAALVVLETATLGARLVRFPSEALHAPWVRWLAAHPSGAVVSVPPALSGKARDYEPVALSMLQGLEHGHPLVLGYSGFFPRLADRLAARAKHFPSRGSVLALREAGVRYVVVDRAWLAAHSPERARLASLALPRRVFRDAAHDVYALGP